MKISLVTICLVAVFVEGVAAATLEQELAGIHERARAAAESRDWESVERLRLDRRRILATSEESSPWVDARRALEAVDGDAEKPGLVDRLEYKEAAKRLLDAWKPFAAARDRPVYGDVAVRLFQVVQQAAAVHRHAARPGGFGELVSGAIVREAIEAAAAGDPCQLEARAIRLFMKPIDRNETFMRLDARPELGAINAELLALSWPGSGPALPHHAPVEFMKAVLTQRLVMEERYGDFLAPEPAATGGEAGSGFVLKGVDARSKPFRLMFGRFLLMEIDDESGRPTSAVVYLDAKGEWDKKYMRLLYRTPGDEELKDPDAAFFAAFFAKLQPITTWSLGPHEFALYDLPIDAVDAVLGRRVPQLCVRKAVGLSKGKFSRTANDPDFVVSQLDRETFPSHPRLLERMQQFVLFRDRTNHALVDLTGLRPGDRSIGLNPLVVMSSDDKVRPTPMFKRSTASGPPFLVLDDANGSIVEFREDTKELVVRYPGIDGHVPLVIDAIPDALVLATAAGRLLGSVLLDCGYSKEQAIAEIRKAFKDPQYVPAKFEELVKAKQRSRRAVGGANAVQIVGEILREKGWSVPRLPGEDLRIVYEVHGFRYLTDARGTIVTNAGLSLPGGLAPAAVGVPAATGMPAAAPERRLEFRSPDGRKAIDDSQVYTAADYQELRTDIATRFLPAIVAVHPCLPAIDQVPFGRRAVGKDDRPVKVPDAVFAGVEAEAGLESALRNRLFGDYAKLMLEARSDRGKLEPIISMQLLAARRLAKTGHFHRSLVFYDELVRLAAGDAAGEPVGGRPVDASGGRRQVGFELLERVPTPAELEAFSRDLQSVLERQKRCIMLQAEQASVLRAAGLRDSARYLFSRISDQFLQYMLPAIELSEDYARSHAFSPGKDLERARKEVMDDLETIANASAGLRREGEFRAVAVAASLGAWAKEKVEARRSMPQRLCDGEFLLNPLRTCPASYDADRGFRSDVESLFPDDLPEKLVAWARLPDREAGRAERAGEYHFLLGWFWLERENPDFAWTSFVEAARAFAPDRRKADLPALVGRRNGMMMLVAAAAVVDSPPGVNAVNMDFIDGLRGQAMLWERAWVANRNDTGHARAQREIIGELLDLARAGIARVARAETKRYYFPDHTFRHGPLPDLLVSDAIRMKLFESVPRDAEDAPIEPPAVTKGEGRKKDTKPHSGKPDEPTKPATELGFEKFLERLYAVPAAIDPEILKLSTP